MNYRIIFPTLPGLFVVIAAVSLLAYAPDAAVLVDAAHGFPYVALAAALALAWRLHSTRAFAAALLLFVVYAALQPAVLGDDALARALTTIFTPIGIGWLALGNDRGFTFTRLRNHVAIAFGPLILGAFACAGRTQSAVDALTSNVIDPIYSEWTGLSQAAALAVALALCVTAARYVMAQRAIDAGLMWFALTGACALAAPAAANARGVWVIAAASVLIIAIVETAHSMAFIDDLTGLPARRALAQALHSVRAPYAVAVVDIDHFKSFNDEHGHDVGDQVLRMVASHLRNVGGGGVAYRSGGEEFTLVFAGLKKREALDHVEALREDVANARFALRNLPRPRGKNAEKRRGRGADTGAYLQVTMSVGVAAALDDAADVQALLRDADHAMYRAKSAGRNRVMA